MPLWTCRRAGHRGLSGTVYAGYYATLRRINKKWLGINSNYLGPTSEFAKSNRQR